MKIFKYVLETDKGLTIEMPRYAQVIHCHEQDNKPTIWAQFPHDTPTENRTFYAVVTGLDFSEDKLDKYIGTCHLDRGKFVCHIYESI